MTTTEGTPITASQALLDQLVADGLVVDGLTITEQGEDVWVLTATVAGGAIRRLLTDHAPTTGVPVQRHEVLDWLGSVELYADRAQRLAIANAIIATGTDDEAEWLVGRGTWPVGERVCDCSEELSETGCAAGAKLNTLPTSSPPGRVRVPPRAGQIVRTSGATTCVHAHYPRWLPVPRHWPSQQRSPHRRMLKARVPRSAARPTPVCRGISYRPTAPGSSAGSTQ